MPLSFHISLVEVAEQVWKLQKIQTCPSDKCQNLHVWWFSTFIHTAYSCVVHKVCNRRLCVHRQVATFLMFDNLGWACKMHSRLSVSAQPPMTNSAKNTAHPSCLRPSGCVTLGQGPLVQSNPDQNQQLFVLSYDKMRLFECDMACFIKYARENRRWLVCCSTSNYITARHTFPTRIPYNRTEATLT